MSEKQDYRWENLNERLSKLENSGIPGVRDFFATSALSVLANAQAYSIKAESVSRYAYEVADAMMVEREKKKNDTTT